MFLQVFGWRLSTLRIWFEKTNDFHHHGTTHGRPQYYSADGWPDSTLPDFSSRDLIDYDEDKETVIK